MKHGRKVTDVGAAAGVGATAVGGAAAAAIAYRIVLSSV